MKPRTIVLALSVAVLPLTSAQATQPTCQAQVGEAVALITKALSVQDVGGRYDTSTGWPAPGEARVGALRYSSGFLLQTDDPRFAHVDAVQSAVRSRDTGCWLGGDFIWGKDGVVTAIDKPHIVADQFRPGYIKPQPDHIPPVVPGHRYLTSSKSFSAAYPWIGLWAVDGSAPRTAIVAFNASDHIVLATLPYRLGNIFTLPSPDSPWTGITVAGAGLREPSPYLQFMWCTDTQEDPQ